MFVYLLTLWRDKWHTRNCTGSVCQRAQDSALHMSALALAQGPQGPHNQRIWGPDPPTSG